MSKIDKLTKQAIDSLVKLFVRVANELPRVEIVNNQIIELEKFLGITEDKVVTSSVSLDGPSMMCMLKALHDGIPNINKSGKTFRIKSIKSFDTDTHGNIIVGTRKDYADALVGPSKFIQLETGDSFYVSDGNAKDSARVIYQDKSISSGFHITAAKSEHAEQFIRSVKHHLKHHNIFKNQALRLEGGSRIGFMPQDNIDETNWDKVIIDEGIREVLKLNCIQPIINGEQFDKLGIPRSRGTILSGPPGTGKTRTIMAICRELIDKCTIIIAYGSDLSSPQAISNIYDTAEALAPSLLILEDIDLAIPNRNSGYTMPLSEILQCMQGIASSKCIVTVATTNHLEALDSALKDRPGRFDKVLEFNHPDTEQCKLLIRLFVDENKRVAEFDIDALAKSCTDIKLSGAQIREIIDFASISKLADGTDAEKIAQKDIDNSIKYFKKTQEAYSKMGFHRSKE